MENDDELSVDSEEQHHYRRAVNTFRSYYKLSMRGVLEKVKWFNNLSDEHKALIPAYASHLANVESCLRKNQDVLNAIVCTVSNIFTNAVVPVDLEETSASGASSYEVTGLCSVIRHFVRDWSTEGQNERQSCYEPVVEAANSLFPKNRDQVKVLVPGAGLGRLPWEFAKAGYNCEGNEFSLFMLFCSNYVINRCQEANAFLLHPWLHQWNNHLTYQNQLRAVSIPDVNPTHTSASGMFSMAAGCFLDAYKSQRCCWHLVATVFFLDTAHNVIEYVEAIYRLLQPGGYWINLGPLLYHFSDMADQQSIELPYEEVRALIEKCGFHFVQEKFDLPAHYTTDLNSMLYHTYRCVFFVCRKQLACGELEKPH